MRVPISLLLLATVLGAQAVGVTGKVVEDELARKSKKSNPLSYAIYLPTTLPKKQPAPLILAIHAGQGSAKQFVGFLRTVAEANGAILAGPRGIRELVGTVGWWWKGDKKELAHIDRLLAHLQKSYRIDPKRISIVALADGAELALKWVSAKKRGIQGVILLNFAYKSSGSPSRVRGTKFVLFATREAREKKVKLRDHVEKAGRILVKARVPCVVRIMPGASRSFFHGWEKEFRKAYQWFEGKIDWPRELAAPAGLEEE